VWLPICGLSILSLFSPLVIFSPSSFFMLPGELYILCIAHVHATLFFISSTSWCCFRVQILPIVLSTTIYHQHQTLPPLLLFAFTVCYLATGTTLPLLVSSLAILHKNCRDSLDIVREHAQVT
jgi:hypothetical protein